MCIFFVLNVENTRNAFYKTRAVHNSYHPYGSNGSPSLLPPHYQSPNEMQYTIGKLYSTDRKGTQPSVRIERIVKPSAPFTISPLMRCNIRSVNCTLRTVRALNHLYGSNGSLSLLPPSLTSHKIFSKFP